MKNLSRRMSDSDDDNGYGNYLQSRRATVQKNRQPVRIYESDSDDEFADDKNLPMIKRKRADSSFEESDDESVVLNVETHDHCFKARMENAEHDYTKRMWQNDGLIHAASNERNDALKKAMQAVKTMVNDVNVPNDEQPTEVTIEEEEKEETPDKIVDAVFPVVILVVDCESSLKNDGVRVRRNVPLESTFCDIRNELAEKWKCHPNQVILTCNETIIDAKMTPEDLGLHPLNVPQLVNATKKREDNSANEQEVITVDTAPGSITIKVQLGSRRKPLYVQAAEETTILEFKQKIIDALAEEDVKTLPNVETMKLMFDDEYLQNDDETCGNIGMEDGDCIDTYF